MSNISIKEMINAGVHFGHQSKYWNPKMRPFIYTTFKKLHIINLEKSITHFSAAKNFIEKIIQKKAIPTPFGIYKDHKKTKNSRGFFGMRFVVPSERQSGCFSKIGFRGIKKILDENQIDYESKTIQNSYQLKSEIEDLRMVKNLSTIISVDIVKMYSSIKYSMIELAVRWFGRSLPAKERE